MVSVPTESVCMTWHKPNPVSSLRRFPLRVKEEKKIGARERIRVT